MTCHIAPSATQIAIVFVVVYSIACIVSMRKLIKDIERMTKTPKLHLYAYYANEGDTVVASSEEEADSIYTEKTGIIAAKEFPGSRWYQLPDDKEFTVVDAEGERKTLTCGEWALKNGKGLLGPFD